MKKYLNVLKKCPLFAGLSDDEILTSLQCISARVRTAQKEQYILRAGERTDCIGLLVSGAALVVQEDLWGNRNIMTQLAPGDYFAEPFAAIPDTVLSVSVVATKECEIMELNMNRMLTMCSSACAHHNRLIKNLITAFAKKTLLFNEKITHMSKRRTRDKLLSYLSSEAVRQGRLSFTIPFDR